MDAPTFTPEVKMAFVLLFFVLVLFLITKEWQDTGHHVQEAVQNAPPHLRPAVQTVGCMHMIGLAIGIGFGIAIAAKAGSIWLQNILPQLGK